ncbi:MAG: purine-cytosine permease family protein [Bacteroidota bacterium]
MKARTISKKLDALYEFDREPVSKNALQGIGNFLGIYAGEHVAGTEFVIGMLFVAHGVSVTDMFLGGLIGNILAVLGWAFITAPIAVTARLSLYWQLKKICGPVLVFLYNIVNALMFCFLAGAMVAVSATAVGIPFNVEMPTLNDMYPSSVGWVVTVFAVGAVITTFAILGFEKLARFSKVAAPWMFFIFLAAAISSLPRLGIHTDLSNFWDVARERIWTGQAVEGQSQFTIWHVIFFTWFANAAMHLGMSDLSILRYAKKWQYGFASAVGMFLGHYVAWISSGILYAAATSDAPGEVAYQAIGIAGALCVIIAGWTTANPTLYRAGLALQVASPGWSRWKVTLLAGLITTIAALFPALVMKLLDFVALYGLVLIPMGGVIFADFYLMKRFGLKDYYAERNSLNFNWAAGITWFLLLIAALIMNMFVGVELYFLPLPAWILSIVLFPLFSKFYQKKMAL